MGGEREKEETARTTWNDVHEIAIYSSEKRRRRRRRRGTY